MSYLVISILAILVLVFIHDRFIQTKHTILKHYPIIGHGRYLIEKIGPELRQYIVANNREEFPFNRVQRSYIYASAKKQNNILDRKTLRACISPGLLRLLSSRIAS